MKITVEFNNLEEIDEFTSKILIGGLKKKEEVVPVKSKPVKEIKKTEKKVSEPVEETEEQAAVEEEEKKTYTFTEVRAALAGLAKTDSKKVKAILNEFGADKLSDIKEEDYSTVMERAGV